MIELLMLLHFPEVAISELMKYGAGGLLALAGVGFGYAERKEKKEAIARLDLRIAKLEDEKTNLYIEKDKIQNSIDAILREIESLNK